MQLFLTAVIFEQTSYFDNLIEQPAPGRILSLYTTVIILCIISGVLIVELTALDTDNRSRDITFSVDDVNFADGIVVFANKTSNNNFYNVNLLVGPNVTRSTFDYDVSICVIISKLLWVSSQDRQRVVIAIRAVNDIGEVFIIIMIILLFIMDYIMVVSDNTSYD